MTRAELLSEWQRRKAGALETGASAPVANLGDRKYIVCVRTYVQHPDDEPRDGRWTDVRRVISELGGSCRHDKSYRDWISIEFGVYLRGSDRFHVTFSAPTDQIAFRIAEAIRLLPAVVDSETGNGMVWTVTVWPPDHRPRQSR